MTQSFLNTPYTAPYLSPLVHPTNAFGPSTSPLSTMSHPGEPVIADQSPPQQHLRRSASADIYPLSFHDQSQMTDHEGNHDASRVSELFIKTTFDLPFRNSVSDQQFQDLDLSTIVNFENFDPASLSPETSQSYST